MGLSTNCLSLLLSKYSAAHLQMQYSRQESHWKFEASLGSNKQTNKQTYLILNHKQTPFNLNICSNLYLFFFKVLFIYYMSWFLIFPGIYYLILLLNEYKYFQRFFTQGWTDALFGFYFSSPQNIQLSVSSLILYIFSRYNYKHSPGYLNRFFWVVLAMHTHLPILWRC